MKRLLLNTALLPFWLTGKVISPIGAERVQGAMLGALALAALTGYVRAEAPKIPLTPEFVQAMIEAGEYEGTIWDEPKDLEPLGFEDAFYTPEAEDVPIPARKPEFVGYSAQDRAELDALFAEVTK